MHFRLWHFAIFTSSLALWPNPQHYEHGSSTLWLSLDVQFHYTSPNIPQSFDWLWESAQHLVSSSAKNVTSPKDQSSPDSILKPAFERMKHNVLNRSFPPQKFYPRNTEFEPAANSSKQYIREVTVLEDAQDDVGGYEGYTMKIWEDGKVLIKIASPTGGLHSLETLAQLFFAHSTLASSSYMPFAPVWIKDSPTFEHRGLNLDISRNWIPPANVRRTIEAMAANKLNRLHLHASDAQSWPLEIPALPDLALKGAYSPSQIWHTDELEAVQRHGVIYGVEVFVEIDLPGHTTSIGNAFPHLLTANNEQWDKYAVEPPSGQLRLNSSDVPPFLNTLLTDLLSRTSQYSSLFHLGGDELNLDAYLIDPTVRSASQGVLQPLIQSFIDQVISLTRSHSLTVVMWEEMVLDWNLTLPQDVIIQTWRGNQDNALSTILDKGYRTLFGSNAYWYLDCGFGSFLDPEPSNPESPVKPPYLDYCQPYKNWRHMYAYDPLADIPEHQRHLVIGGEAHLWGELTDSVDLDGMLWPRVAAAAEVMWSGSGKRPDESTTRRLADMRERLLMRGVRAGVVQMEWCLRYKGGCTL